MAFQAFNFGNRLGLVGPGAEAASEFATSKGGGGPVTVSGRTVVEWPPDGCGSGSPAVKETRIVESSPLDPGYRVVIMGCDPPSSSGGGGGEGPITYYDQPAPKPKDRYPLPIEDFKKQTSEPPSSEDIESLIQTCPDGPKAGCCDEFSRQDIAQTIKDFFDKDRTIMNKYPPHVYNCLLEAFKKLKKIKCHVQKDLNASLEYYLSSDGTELSIGDLTIGSRTYSVLYNVLIDMLSREYNRGVDNQCTRLGGFVFAVLGFEGPLAGDQATHEWILEWCKRNRRQYYQNGDPLVYTTPDPIIVIDMRDGSVYSNPFWPSRAPKNWKPQSKNRLYRDPRYMCP